jgi:PleD family two-component response regulator
VAERSPVGKSDGVSKDDNAPVDLVIPAQTRVLLAEDDESFVDALVIGLAREGFDVTVATSSLSR